MPTSIGRAGIAFATSILLAACGGGSGGGAPSLRGRIVKDGVAASADTAYVSYPGGAHELELVGGVFELGSDLAFMTEGQELTLRFEDGPQDTFRRTSVFVVLPDRPVDLGDVDLSRKGFSLVDAVPADGASCPLECTFTWRAYGGPWEFARLFLWRDGEATALYADDTGGRRVVTSLPTGAGPYLWWVDYGYELPHGWVYHESGTRTVNLQAP